MLRYKINVSDALSRAGVNKYKAKKTKVIGQDTLTKLAEDIKYSLCNSGITAKRHFRVRGNAGR